QVGAAKQQSTCPPLPPADVSPPLLPLPSFPPELDSPPPEPESVPSPSSLSPLQARVERLAVTTIVATSMKGDFMPQGEHFPCHPPAPFVASFQPILASSAALLRHRCPGQPSVPPIKLAQLSPPFPSRLAALRA